MIYLVCLINSLIIAFSSYLNFSTKLSYFLVFIFSGLNAIAWAYLVKHSATPGQAMIKGVYWDTIRALVYFSVPMMLFQPKFSWMALVGLFMSFFGILLTRF